MSIRTRFRFPIHGRIVLFTWSVFACLFASMPVFAQAIELKSDSGKIAIERVVEYYREPGNSLTIEQLLQKPDAVAWTKNKKKSLNFGFTTDTVWLRFRVRDAGSRRRLLVIPYTLEYVDLYRVRGNVALETFSHGLGKPSAPHNHIIFPLPSTRGKEGVFYLRVRSRYSMSIPAAVWDREAFLQADYYEQLLFGFYFGILFIMAAYNLFVFFSVRQPAYLYYVLWLIALLMYQISKFGYDKHLLGDHMVWMKTYSTGFIGALVGVLSVQFSRSYLNLRATFPRMDRFALGLMALFALPTLLIPFVQLNIPLRMLAVTLLVTTVFLISIGAAAWRGGFRPARYFTMAWAFLMITTFAYSLKLLGFVPNNFLTNFGFLFGSVLEVMLLSLGLGDFINHFRREKEEAQRDLLDTRTALLEATSRFVPQQFISILGKESILDVKLGDSVEKELAILFSDIRAFTHFSETMSPDDNFGFINSYLKRMEPAIRSHEGFIDKYIGDAIMALYPRGAADAVRSAIAMQKILAQHNVRRRERDFEAINIGIGIHAGRMMLGTVGGDMRMDTTVISDSVNVASRLEGLTKVFGSRIIASEDALVSAGEHSFTSRKLGKIQVKGKDQPVNIIEILDADEPNLFDAKMKHKDDFERAVDHYRLGEFGLARELFAKIHETGRRDSAAELYLRRCGARAASA